MKLISTPTRWRPSPAEWAEAVFRIALFSELPPADVEVLSDLRGELGDIYERQDVRDRDIRHTTVMEGGATVDEFVQWRARSVRWPALSATEETLVRCAAMHLVGDSDHLSPIAVLFRMEPPWVISAGAEPELVFPEPGLEESTRVPTGELGAVFVVRGK